MSSSSSRLECLGKSSPGSKKQPAGEVTSAHAETHNLSDTHTKKTVDDKPRRSLPACALQPFIQETTKSGSLNWDLQNTEVCAPKESINITPRIEEQAESAAVSGEELTMKAQPSAITGTTLASPRVELLSMHEVNEEKEEKDEDLKAPVELIIEFLRAALDSDFQLASKLCQTILIYEPDNLEALEFFSLVRKLLQEEQEAEESSEEDSEDDDDSDGNDDDEFSNSSSSSSSSCSSPSPSDDDEVEEKQVDRHKPCPLSHISK